MSLLNPFVKPDLRTPEEALLEEEKGPFGNLGGFKHKKAKSPEVNKLPWQISAPPQPVQLQQNTGISDAMRRRLEAPRRSLETVPEYDYQLDLPTMPKSFDRIRENALERRTRDGRQLPQRFNGGR